MTEDGEILVYFSAESLKGFQPPEEWRLAVLQKHREREQKQEEEKRRYLHLHLSSRILIRYRETKYLNISVFSYSPSLETALLCLVSVQSNSIDCTDPSIFSPVVWTFLSSFVSCPLSSGTRTGPAARYGHTNTSLSLRQKLFHSFAEPPEPRNAPVDITHTLAPPELLAHKLMRSVEAEKAESRR